MHYKKTQTSMHFEYVDDSQTYLLPREKFEIGLAKIENRARQRKYQSELNQYNKKVADIKSKGGKDLPAPPKKPEFVEVPTQKKSETTWYIDINEDKYLEPKADVVSSVVKDKESFDFVESIKVDTLEKVNYKSLSLCEVQNTGGAKENKNYIAPSEGVKARDASALSARLKNFSLEIWILMVCRIYKSIPNLIALIDLDVKRIAYNSPRLSERGMSTIKQLESLQKMVDRKEQYLNLYVLNKLFAGMLENEMEREVFLIVFQRSKDMRQLESQKLRTAYRVRRNILKRFKEFCLTKGYDANWFYNHFSGLSPVRYFAEVHDNDKRLEELRLGSGEI